MDAYNIGDDLLFLEALNKIPLEYSIHVYSSGLYFNNFTGIRNFIILNSIRKVLLLRFDFVLYYGGGLFPSAKFGLKRYIQQSVILQRNNFINGVGIVPKKGLFNNLFFKLFLKKIRYISVRDNISKSYVDSLIGKGKCINCSDLYFGKDLLSINLQKKRERKGCLVCLANPFSEKEKEDIHTMERYNELVVLLQKACIHLKEKESAVTFLPFYQGSDDIFIADIMKHPQLSNCKILLCERDYTLNNIDELFTHYAIGINMRFHSFVLSIRNCLPFIGICYDYKSESLLQEINMEQYGIRYGIRTNQFFCSTQDIDEKELMDKINRVFTDKELIQKKMIVYRTLLNKRVNANYNKIFHLIKKTYDYS